MLAEVVRCGLVESRHRGSIIALDTYGRVAFGMGDTTTPMYPRSANKPAQAVAMIRHGLPLDGQLLALAAASHSGESFHQDGALRILEAAGLDVTDLQNTPGWPLQDTVAHSYVRAGGERSSLAADCSGKHAAMLLTCVVNGWPTLNYLDPEHPLQAAITAGVGQLAGEEAARVAVDGCGAPLHAITLAGLARTFRALALAEPGTPEGQVAAGIREHPSWVSGTTREEAALIDAVPGLIAKVGAEAVYAAALPDGRAVAVKIDDGAGRSLPVVMAAALRRLGVQADVLDRFDTAPVLGGGRVVGEIRACGI